MPTGLKQYYGKGHLHFLTFICYDRLPFLRNEFCKNLLVNELAPVRAEYGFRLIGYVVMPEHVHLLVSELDKGPRRNHT
jgi:REP-associated tyrosine transposase